MNENEMMIYQNGELRINVHLSEKTIWLNQQQLATVFQTTKQNISKHINRLFNSGELNKNQVVNFWFTTGNDGKDYQVAYYNLKVLIYLGWIIKSDIARPFRNWAEKILEEHSLQGYSINKITCLECQEKMISLQNQIYEIRDFQNKSLTLKETDRVDAMFMLQEILRSAKHILVIVDNYFDHSFNEILLHSPAKVVVITHPKNESFESDKYKVIKVDKFHDRYLFVDNKAYHFGESFNKLGTDISTCTYLPNFSIDNFLDLTGLKI